MKLRGIEISKLHEKELYELTIELDGTWDEVNLSMQHVKTLEGFLIGIKDKTCKNECTYENECDN